MLAERAGCSVRTVQRALQQARDVSWCERRVRAARRWLRTSNRWRCQASRCRRFRAHDGDAAPLTGLCDPEGERKEKGAWERSEELAAMVRSASGLPDLLAARRAVVAARLAAGRPREIGSGHA